MPLVRPAVMLSLLLRCTWSATSLQTRSPKVADNAMTSSSFTLKITFMSNLDYRRLDCRDVVTSAAELFGELRIRRRAEIR